jgi:hypothetical protein
MRYWYYYSTRYLLDIRDLPPMFFNRKKPESQSTSVTNDELTDDLFDLEDGDRVDTASSSMDDTPLLAEDVAPAPVAVATKPVVNSGVAVARPAMATMGGFNFPKLSTNTTGNKPNPQQHGAFSSQQQATISSTVFQEPATEVAIPVSITEPVAALPVQPSEEFVVSVAEPTSLLMPPATVPPLQTTVQQPETFIVEAANTIDLPDIAEMLPSFSQENNVNNNVDDAFTLDLSMSFQNDASNDNADAPLGFTTVATVTESSVSTAIPREAGTVLDDFSLSLDFNEPEAISVELTEPNDFTLTVAQPVIPAQNEPSADLDNWMDFSLEIEESTTEVPNLLALDDVPPGIFALPAYGIGSTLIDPQEEFIESIELQTHHAVAGTPEYTMTQFQPISSSIELTGLAIEDSFATLLQANELSPELVLQDITVAEQQVALNLPETPSLTGFSAGDDFTLDISQFEVEETSQTQPSAQEEAFCLHQDKTTTFISAEEPSFLLDFSDEPILSVEQVSVTPSFELEPSVTAVVEPSVMPVATWPIQSESSVTVVEHNIAAEMDSFNTLDTASILGDVFDFTEPIDAPTENVIVEAVAPQAEGLRPNTVVGAVEEYSSTVDTLQTDTTLVDPSFWVALNENLAQSATTLASATADDEFNSFLAAGFSNASAKTAYSMQDFEAYDVDENEPQMVLSSEDEPPFVATIQESTMVSSAPLVSTTVSASTVAVPSSPALEEQQSLVAAQTEMLSLATILGTVQSTPTLEHEPIIDLSKHKISDYIGSTLPFYDLTLEKIKVLAMAPLQQENSAILYVEIEPFFALFGLLNNQFHLLHTFNTNPITGLSASPQQVFMLNLNATSQTLGDIYELKIGNWHTLLAVTQQHIGLQRISSVG